MLYIVRIVFLIVASSAMANEIINEQQVEQTLEKAKASELELMEKVKNIEANIVKYSNVQNNQSELTESVRNAEANMAKYSNTQNSQSEVMDNVKNIEAKMAQYLGAQDTQSQTDKSVNTINDSNDNLVASCDAQSKQDELSKNTFSIDEAINTFKGIKNDISNDKEGLYIFVSFSMPQELLNKLDKLARTVNAKVVIRGLKNNSFKDTIQHVYEINKEGLKIDIDPIVYSEFKIDRVPAFVLSDGVKFDKLVGNVSLNYALESFASNGDLSNQAKIYLSRLSHE